MPGILRIQLEDLEQMQVVHRDQILCLQVRALVPENKIRVENNGIQGTVFAVYRADRVHDVLVDESALPRFQDQSHIVGGHLGVSIRDEDDLHLLMPVPVDIIQIGLVHGDGIHAEWVVEMSVVLLLIEIVVHLHPFFTRSAFFGIIFIFCCDSSHSYLLFPIFFYTVTIILT